MGTKAAGTLDVRSLLESFLVAVVHRNPLLTV